MACLGTPCLIAYQDKRCSDCDRFCNATHDLAVLLKAAPWQVSGCDATSAEPPSDMQHHPRMADEWRRSWRLRLELEAAAAKRKASA